MRYLVISDIHGNLEALEEVLKQTPPFDQLVCLGDLVGYGASPNEVITTVRSHDLAGVIRGNHDKVCAGLDPGFNFNNNAYASAMWTRDRLSPDNFDYLRQLPEGPVVVSPDITIAHGSPMDEDYYILYENDAYISFQAFNTRLCFFGHSHVPGIFVLEESASSFYYFIPRGDATFKLRGDGSCRYLVNPGSVGQPRDYDPRASFCLLDTEQWTLSFFKLNYPTKEAARKITAAGLPEFLAERLFTGM